MSNEALQQSLANYFDEDETIDDTPPTDLAPTRTTAPIPDAEQYDPTGNFMENVLAGLGRSIVQKGRMGKDLYLDAFGTPEQQAENEAALAEARRLDAPLMDTVGGNVGNIAGDMVAFAPTAAIPGANTVVGAGLLGGLMGAAGPTIGDESRVDNAMTDALLSAGTQKGMNLLGNRLRNVAEEYADRQHANRDTRRVVKEAVDAGIKLDPAATTERRGLLTDIARGWSGKTRTQFKMRDANQQTFNNLAKEELGIPETEELSKDLLKAVGREFGEQQKKIVETIPDIDHTEAFDRRLSEIFRKYQSRISENPSEANKEIDRLREFYGETPKFNTENTLDRISELRYEAADLYKATGDVGGMKRSRAQMKRDLADALEDMVEENLEKSDAPGLERYRELRKKVAQSHAVSDALEGGNVDAMKLRKRTGLTGNLKQIAEVADRFPAVSKRPTEGTEAFSVTDLGVGGASMAAGTPSLAAAIALRPLVLKGLLSDPIQRRTVLSPETLQTRMAMSGLLSDPERLYQARVAGPAFTEEEEVPPGLLVIE